MAIEDKARDPINVNCFYLLNGIVDILKSSSDKKKMSNLNK